MRVCVFDASGQLLGRLQLQDALQFPNAICAGVGRDGSDELYVSDNRAHCVKVFDYRGTLKRSIGGPGARYEYSYTALPTCFLLLLLVSYMSTACLDQRLKPLLLSASPRAMSYSYTVHCHLPLCTVYCVV